MSIYCITLKYIENEIAKHPENTIINYIDNKVDIYYKYRFVTMELNKGWPFYPPKNVIIINKSVRFGSHQVPYNLYQRYKSVYNECPCCECIINGNNWSPLYTIEDIVKQYDDVMRRYKKLYIKKWIHYFIPNIIPKDLNNDIINYLC